MSKCAVFLSYSRHDARLVASLGRLIRASGSSVFRDEENIEPGTRWQAVLAEAIREAHVMFVFWCRHSASSSSVRDEYLTAIQNGLRVAPILLDATPLTAELSEFQALDFREIDATHLELGVMPFPADQHRRARLELWVAEKLHEAMVAFLSSQGKPG